MPFLGEPTRRMLGLDAQRPISRHTFHPQLPGLAFVGIWDQSGPMFPPVSCGPLDRLRLERRHRERPTPEGMEVGVAECRARGVPEKPR